MEFDKNGTWIPSVVKHKTRHAEHWVTEIERILENKRIKKRG